MSWGDRQSGFRADERGVTVQVGFVLLVGILVVALATWQVTVVPTQNADVEFEHSQTVQSDVADLRNALLRTAGSATAQPTSVSLGTRYPNRVLFVNPAPASGSLRTVGGDDARLNTTIENARVESEYENARAYWANAADAGVFGTGELVYTPDYSEYENAPTVAYENSLVLNQFDDGTTMARSGQTLVSGNTITLVSLQGSLSESAPRPTTVDTHTISEVQNTVTVRSTANDPLVLAVTSRLPASAWADSVLAGQAAVADVRDRGNWTEGGATYHRVAIELRPGAYELRAGSVGVGALTDDEATPDPAYLVAVDDYRTVGNGSEGTTTVEARDRFNNPRSDTAVNVSVDPAHLRVWNGSAWNESATLRTDADGRATVRYRAINVTGEGESASLEASIDDGAEGYETVSYTGLSVPVVAFGGDGDGDGGNGDLNPGSAGDLVLQSNALSGSSVEVSLRNTIDRPVNVTYARLNFYYSTQDSRAPSFANLSVASENQATLPIKGDWVELNTPITLDPGLHDPAFTLDFEESNQVSVYKQDFFVLTVVYEYDGQQYQATYFISPDQE
jgi:hypothetical protein